MSKRILFSASIFHGLNDAATVTVPMIFPLLYSQQSIITKYTHIGILSNLGLMVTLVCQLIIAHYAHKYEYRHMLLLSLAGISLSLVLITFSWSFGTLLLFYLVMRIFASFYHSVGVATVSISHPDKALDFAMGVQSGSGNIGLFLAFIATGFIAQSFSWQTPLLALAVILFVLGTISFLTVKKTSTMNADIQPPEARSWKQAINETSEYFPGFFFGGACWGTTIFYAPSLFHHKFHVSLGKTGLYLALWIAIGTLMPYLLGYLSQKIGRRNIILFGFFGSTLFLGILGLSPSKELAAISLVLFGAFLFMIYPALQSVVGNRVSTGIQTQAFSIVANVQMFAGAVVSLIAGFLSDALGINSPFLFVAIIGIFTTAYFIKRRKSI
ncbi:MAG: MFS transporter [Candidatus Aminicenantaceae bacterium]|jgi:FSR family fosmidomycin resistance protein-like MFS transporter